MYLGSAFPHKNLEKLVDAFDNLQLNHPSSSCFCRKEKINYEELERRAKNAPSAKTLFLPVFCPTNKPSGCTKHVQVYVFRRSAEGFGLPPWKPWCTARRCFQ